MSFYQGFDVDILPPQSCTKCCRKIHVSKIGFSMECFTADFS